MLRIHDAKSSNPFKAIKDDLLGGDADIMLGNVWQSVQNYIDTDLTIAYERSCLTFLVPIPTFLHESTLIYKTFSSGVWALSGVFFVLTAFVLWSFGRVFRSGSFRGIFYYVTELINIATSHGSRNYPPEISMKTIVMWWVVDGPTRRRGRHGRIQIFAFSIVGHWRPLGLASPIPRDIHRD